MSSLKLKKAMAEIKAILEKNDIAGSVVLHTPGHSEFLIQVDPSYSCCRIENNQIRVRALQKDYQSLQEWKKCLTDTSNMLHLLSRTMGHVSLELMHLSDKVTHHTQAVHHNPNFFTNKN